MTLVKCLECGSDQDFEEAVGYCEQCGHKLPVPLHRGKTEARRKLMAESGSVAVRQVNVLATAGVFLAGAAAVLTLAILVIRSQF
jgi:uncharacterized membrane protein YvbJ